MQTKHQKEEHLTDSAKTTPSHQQHKSKITNKKINLKMLSLNLYHQQEKHSAQKIVFYDQFQSEKQDIDGAITSRFIPHLTDGDSMIKFTKVDNLQTREQSPSKGKKERQQKRTKQRKQKIKQKRLINRKQKDNQIRNNNIGIFGRDR